MSNRSDLVFTAVLGMIGFGSIIQLEKNKKLDKARAHEFKGLTEQVASLQKELETAAKLDKTQETTIGTLSTQVTSLKNEQTAHNEITPEQLAHAYFEKYMKVPAAAQPEFVQAVNDAVRELQTYAIFAAKYRLETEGINGDIGYSGTYSGGHIKLEKMPKAKAKLTELGFTEEEIQKVIEQEYASMKGGVKQWNQNYEIETSGKRLFTSIQKLETDPKGSDDRNYNLLTITDCLDALNRVFTKEETLAKLQQLAKDVYGVSSGKLSEVIAEAQAYQRQALGIKQTSAPEGAAVGAPEKAPVPAQQAK